MIRKRKIKEKLIKLYRVIKRFVISVIENDFYGMASEMGFMMVIGIFPFMLFLTAVFGWMGNKSLMTPVLMFLSNIMPEQAMALIKTVLNEAMIFSHGKLMAITGICVTIFLSSNAMAVVLKGLNRAYKVEETRNFLYTRTLSLIMVFVDTMVLFLTINLIVFGKLIVNFFVMHFHMSKVVAITLLTLRWPIAFAALYLMAFLSYYILPDLRGNDKFKRQSALPGTFFFCIFWLVGSWGFSIYVNNLKTYNMVYGTIGAFAVLMMWMYYTSVLILVGGEINSQVYNKLSEKAREIQADLDALKKLNKKED
ncbi:MAG: YihY/virulence factor BrkB family protein [Brachyspira sp.]|nr:YihY/virulence factor BrkB family protein [Brachyspira sp.]